MKPNVGDAIIPPDADLPGRWHGPRVTEVEGDLGRGQRWFVLDQFDEGHAVEATSLSWVWREVRYVPHRGVAQPKPGEKSEV